MKNLIFFILIHFCMTALGSSQIQSLLDDQSMVPNKLIFFKLNLLPGEFFSSMNLSSKTGNCKIAFDPYIKSTLVLMCKEPENNLTIQLKKKNKDSQIVQINYGPINVRKIGENLKVIPPLPNNFDEQLYNKGKVQFGQYCVGCHHNNPTSPVNITTKTKSDVELIINTNRSEMGSRYGAKSALDSGNLNLDELLYFINNYRGD